MVIGVPKEIKDHEFRVALTPHGVKELCGRGHRVLVQKGSRSTISPLPICRSMISVTSDSFPTQYHTPSG